MAKLTAAKRNKLSSKTFGMPASRKYPMPDRAHAANAKARATQMVEKGKLSPSSAAKIRSKANKLLGETEMKHHTKHEEKKHHSEHHVKKHHAAKHEGHKSGHHHEMKAHHEHMKKLEHEIHKKHKEHKKARDHMHKLA